jgi:tetratricopeptide (TPR) repeat protein
MPPSNRILRVGTLPSPRARAALLAVLLGAAAVGPSIASPHIPAIESEVLAEVPAGAAHESGAARALTRERIDVAIPVATVYIERSRDTGDLRFLGYAEATLAPWVGRQPIVPAAWVLHATILQSRHAFGAALTELDRVLAITPEDPQAWLTRASVLRVLGRYDESLDSCDRLKRVDASIASLCAEGVRALTGHLTEAYAAIAALQPQLLSEAARALRCSELAEMSERLGDDEAAEHWFREGLELAPKDLYVRNAYADLLLRRGRSGDVLQLLSGQPVMEPVLLRRVLAGITQRGRPDDGDRQLLSEAFALESARGDAVHRREQARFLLDVEHRPGESLAAAQANWAVQREPADLLVLLRSARAAQRADAAQPALQFLHETGLQDARLTPYLSAR